MKNIALKKTFYFFRKTILWKCSTHHLLSKIWGQNLSREGAVQQTKPKNTYFLAKPNKSRDQSVANQSECWNCVLNLYLTNEKGKSQNGNQANLIEARETIILSVVHNACVKTVGLTFCIFSVSNLLESGATRFLMVYCSIPLKKGEIVILDLSKTFCINYLNAPLLVILGLL